MKDTLCITTGTDVVYGKDQGMNHRLPYWYILDHSPGLVYVLPCGHRFGSLTKFPFDGVEIHCLKCGRESKCGEVTTVYELILYDPIVLLTHHERYLRRRYLINQDYAKATGITNLMLCRMVGVPKRISLELKQ